jgi:ArsR family transcriptional regulator
MMKDRLLEKQEAIFCLLAKFGDALSSPKRLKIVSLLSQGEKSVDQLAVMSGQSLAAASAHLKVLRASGLVTSRKEGRHVWCALAGDSVTHVWLALRALGEELLPEVREIIRDYFEQPETLSTLTMQEVLAEVRHDRVILLDLRNDDEYLSGHLPGAWHIPFANLADRITELPPGTPILAYCRGPYCVTSLKGTNALRERGLAVRRLPFGVPEWKAAGLPLDEADLQTIAKS